LMYYYFYSHFLMGKKKNLSQQDCFSILNNDQYNTYKLEQTMF